jgi:hypothetical protein
MWSPLLGLALVARSMVEGISFDCPVQLTTDLAGEGGMVSPPIPPIAGADMDPHLSGDAPRGTGEAQQKGGEHPARQRTLAAVQERTCEVMERALQFCS